MTKKEEKIQHFSLCTVDEVADCIGLTPQTIKVRWLKNTRKVKQYNGIQLVSFLEKENIDEQTLYKLVKLYNGIINDKDTINKIFKKVLEKI